MKKTEKSIEFAGRTLTLSTGRVAKQATGAIMASYGETVVLATVVSAPLQKVLDYFPLSVDYQERLYAGGRIKGSRWVKREGRPTDEEILTGRLIDRSIRPLFSKYYTGREVQVIITVLSVDLENSPDVLSAIATSAALSISSIPWEGPVGVVRVGIKDDKFEINPTVESKGLDLVVSSTKDAAVMIEAGAKEVPEDKMLDAIATAHKESQKLIKFIADFQDEVGSKKETIEKPKANTGLEKKVKDLVGDKLEAVVKSMLVSEGGKSFEYEEMLKAVTDTVENEEKEQVFPILEKLKKEYIRKVILSGKRLDGRKHDEIRPLSAEVGVLPRTHGSAIFNRGETQALTVTTLGARSEELFLESAEGEETKRYIHHYSFPPFSTGETGKVGNPSRREIGHGALAERALLPVIPATEDFPYTIRLVTEILGSNGSTSMASTCGSTLSLMDAGVPIKTPVGGIAMGLIVESEKEYAVLTDIMGIEDFNGDMDFKVTGTKDGITALQLDVKTLQLTLPILEKAIGQAKKARMEVLDLINKTIDGPRKNVSVHAPKIKMTKVPVEKIGELIGPGGRVIKALIAETGAMIDVEDDGTVSISGVKEEEVDGALNKINAMMREPKAGEIYEGTVARLQPFGAFVEILPGKDGLVHVSDMSMDFVKDPRDIVNEGDKVTVRVKEIDNMGRINLSMLLDPAADAAKAEKRDSGGGGGGGDRGGFRQGSQSFGGRSSGGGFNRGGRSSGGRDMRGGRGRQDRNDRGNADRGGRGSVGGPHFPTSRLLSDSDR